MQILGPHKNSWIRIRESESECIRITFSAICESGPSPDLELFAFRGFIQFFNGSGSKDPDLGLCLIQAALEKFYYGPLIKFKQIRATFLVNLDFFRIF